MKQETLSMGAWYGAARLAGVESVTFTDSEIVLRGRLPERREAVARRSFTGPDDFEPQAVRALEDFREGVRGAKGIKGTVEPTPQRARAGSYAKCLRHGCQRRASAGIAFCSPECAVAHHRIKA